MIAIFNIEAINPYLYKFHHSRFYQYGKTQKLYKYYFCYKMSTWKTNNQSYGSHYSRPSTAPKKKIGKSTLQYIESLDPAGFIHQQENIAKRQRHGLFGEPVGLATGDVYNQPKPQKPSTRMEVNQRMQQKVGPQLFSKPGSTNIGDLYKDPFRAKQLYIKEKGDLSIHPKSFAAGGKQKLVKHSQFEHKKQFDDKQFKTRDESGKVITGPKNITTNNMKKGYGNTTSGHLFGKYPYQGYPEEDESIKNQNQRLLHKAQIPTPFRPSSHPSKTFTPDYALYNIEEPYQQKKYDETFRTTSKKQWKATNPNKKGYNGTFNAFPQYIDEGENKKESKKEEKVWIPNFNGTSKGIGETLSRPCVPASQMMLNQMRRTKS